MGISKWKHDRKETMIMWFLWSFVCIGSVSRCMNESKFEREGRAEDTHLGVITNRKQMR